MGETESHLTEHLGKPALRALIEAMYLIAYADQEFSDVERRFFERSLRTLTRDRVDEQELNDILEDLQERERREGLHACLSDIASRLDTPESRLAAVVLASDMAAADGVIEPSERELLTKLGKALQVDDQIVARALEGLER